MPLTSKGNDILSNMEKEYGSEKGKEVFYASKNAGTVSGVDSAMDNRKDEMSVAERLDTMSQQVNALGQAAARVADRMDAGPREETTKWRFYFSIGGKGKSNREKAHIDVSGKLSVALAKAEREARKQWPDATAIIHERSEALN